MMKMIKVIKVIIIIRMAPASHIIRPLGSQVAKRVLAEAEQSERALEQIFGDLLVLLLIYCHY